MALNITDRLLLGWVAFTTAIVLVRGPGADPAYPWLLAAHAAFAVVLVGGARRGPRGAFWGAVHDIYPIALLLPFYAELGILNRIRGAEAVLANDAVVQGVEEALFGQQVSYVWIREQPSVFLSGLLHLAYFAYYPIVVLGPLALAISRRRADTRTVVRATMLAFVCCYAWFVLYPVAGPYYAFDAPTGPAREVWSARWVYAVLAGGSSFGTAFPSSHVAATIAATTALWWTWRALARWFAVPAVLLTVATVYCQMHYAVDALAGVAVGAAAGWASVRLARGERA